MLSSRRPNNHRNGIKSHVGIWLSGLLLKQVLGGLEQYDATHQFIKMA